MTDKFKNKRVAVVGIGKSNLPLAEFLIAHGAVVTARDIKERDTLKEGAVLLEKMGAQLICGAGYLEDLTEDYIFRAPGVRYDKPEFLAAAQSSSVITSEMELFFELCPAKIFGVTGSDGKTTTTTLISLFLREAVKQSGQANVYLGGNIGRSLIPDLPKMTSDDFAVVELSSFQLHTMRRSPDVAVVTNLSPNHLDYHTDMNEYIDAKRNIYRHQKPGGRLVLNFKNEITASMAADAAAAVEVLPFLDPLGVDTEGNASQPQPSLNAKESDRFICVKGVPALKISDILTPGWHNVENYMAAIAATDGYVSPEIYSRVAKSFPGVEHRNEFVRELYGVKYYNSSIDSSPTRTTAALMSYDRKVIIICGGYDKNIPMEPLAAPLTERAKAIVLTGATAAKIRAAVESYSPTVSRGGKDAAEPRDTLIPPIIYEPDFARAVLAAKEIAEPGDIVLLSPASASFDAFPNFEARGNAFKEIVNSFK